MDYRISIKGLIFFELLSFLGRTFLRQKPHLAKGKNYLNMGSGTGVVDGFVNADFFRPRFWRKKAHKLSWQLDLRYPLQCKDDVFDGVYTSHTLEHLYPEHVANLLKEIRRIMKPGTTLRIVLPDLEKYILYYTKDNDKIDYKEFEKQFSSGCTAIRSLTQNSFHLSVWDFREIKKYLELAGFTNVKKRGFNESDDDSLKIDIKKRDWESMYIEAIK